MRNGDATYVERAPEFIESSELAQILEAGRVAGRKDDRVDRLLLAIAPDHMVIVQMVEHGPPIEASPDQLLFIASAVSDDRAANDLCQPLGREPVKASLPIPVVDVFTAKTLGDEAHRFACCQRDRGHRGKIAGDLEC